MLGTKARSSRRAVGALCWGALSPALALTFWCSSSYTPIPTWSAGSKKPFLATCYVCLKAESWYFLGVSDTDSGVRFKLSLTLSRSSFTSFSPTTDWQLSIIKKLCIYLMGLIVSFRGEQRTEQSLAYSWSLSSSLTPSSLHNIVMARKNFSCNWRCVSLKTK